MRVVGGVVGAVIGSFVGAPQLGWAVGAAIGGTFEPNTQIQGNTIGEISNQTSREGVPYPIVFGVVRPIGGVLIASAVPVIVSTTESQGKGGGGGTETTSESVYRTYAIAVCEGPITGFRRIWSNGKLEYDARPDSEWGIANNAAFLAKARLFTGAWDQLPSPDLEAEFGVGEVPAHRGLAYMAIVNEDLTGSGGAIPQWTFEVVGAEGTFLTSRPYAVETQDGMDDAASGFVSAALTYPPFTLESLDASGPDILSGELRALLVDYQDGLPEGLDDSGPDILSGELRVLLVDYQDGLPEGLDDSGPDILNGQLKMILVTYNNGLPESLDDSGPDILGGTLA